MSKKSPEATRGAGRTTRMLQKAIELASRGVKVYVVGANAAYAKDLELRAGQINFKESRKIRFIGNGTFDNNDNGHGGIIGEYASTVVLHDHQAIEVRVQQFKQRMEIIRMWNTKYGLA